MPSAFLFRKSHEMSYYRESVVSVEFVVKGASEQEAGEIINASLRPLITKPGPPRSILERYIRAIYVEPTAEPGEYKARIAVIFCDQEPEDKSTPLWLLEIVKSPFDPQVRFVSAAQKLPVFSS